MGGVYRIPNEVQLQSQAKDKELLCYIVTYCVFRENVKSMYCRAEHLTYHKVMFLFKSLNGVNQMEVCCMESWADGALTLAAL